MCHLSHCSGPCDCSCTHLFAAFELCFLLALESLCLMRVYIRHVDCCIGCGYIFGGTTVTVTNSPQVLIDGDDPLVLLTLAEYRPQ